MLYYVSGKVAILEPGLAVIDCNGVGYGNATKHQVQDMTKRLLHLNAMPKPDDAADAIAIALCHGRSATSLLAQAQKQQGGFV